MNDVEDVRLAVQSAWSARDPGGRAVVVLRPDGKVDVTIVSELFAGLESAEREQLYWSAVRSLPEATHVRMTYALLLDPSEAARYFAIDSAAER